MNKYVHYLENMQIFVEKLIFYVFLHALKYINMVGIKSIVNIQPILKRS